MNINISHTKALTRHIGAKQWLSTMAVLALIASCISMAAIYQDPFAHIKICFGGAASMPDSSALILFGHCAWCYLTVGLGLSALIAPPKA